MTCLNKKILIGITASIAAYKICELIRLLRTAGAQVQVVMTSQAKEFITPLTLEVLSGKPVYSELFMADFESNIGHIQLARWPDMVLIAPASANFIARLRHGLADDLLTTLCLATSAPIAIAPAMNIHMWNHPATQANVNELIRRNTHFIGPAEGLQACGDEGVGRLVAATDLAAWLEDFFTVRSESIFTCKKIMITAGPTHEAIDPVRYISTRSSGCMGYVLAETLAKLGADVVLVSGPSSLSTPINVKKIEVISADEMYQAVMKNLPCDIFIGAAAVSDYRPGSRSHSKIKREADSVTISLVKNPDILCSVQQFTPRPFMVGFAAETDDHLDNAKKKLINKNIDIIVVNSVAGNKGFGVDVKNAVSILSKEGQQIDLPELNKAEIAKHLLAYINDLLKTKSLMTV